MRRLLLSLAMLGFLPACQNPPTAHRARYRQQDHTPTAQQTAAWIRNQGITEASAEEIASANTTEIHLRQNKAIFPNGGYLLVFTMGKLCNVEAGKPSGPHTTTSSYVLKNALMGKVEARIESTLSVGLKNDIGYQQKLWVSPSGRQVVIHEAWNTGCGTPDMTALLSRSADNSSWNVKYLALPDFSSMLPGEGEAPKPCGFLNDDILLFHSDGLEGIYKKPISEVKEIGGPLPFTVG